MVNSNMREYNYFLYTDNDGYGQSGVTEEVQGTVKMSINLNTRQHTLQRCLIFRPNAR